MKITALLITCILFLTTTALGQDLFPSGSESKAAGIESSLHSRGGSSLLYNPANLSLSSVNEGQIELGFISATQSYEHADFDPVIITVRSPIASLGYVASQFDPKLRFGVIVFPAKSLDQNVPGFPKRIGGVYSSLDADIKEQVTKLGVGTSYQLPHKLAAGLSLIYVMETRKIGTESVEDSTSVLNFDGKTNYAQPVVGLFFNDEKNLVSLSFRPSHIKTYKGTKQSALDTAPVDSTTEDYQAANIGIGYKRQITPNFDLSLETNIQTWTDGKSKHRDGLEAQNKRADFKDVIEKSIQLGYTINNSSRASASYSILPTPWGDGYYTSDVSKQVEGTEFGRANSMNRNALCLGYTLKTAELTEYSSAFYYLAASREVAADGDHPGYYQLEIALISFSLNKNF